MQRKIRFKIDGEELVIGQSPYFFDSITGLSSSANEINNQSRFRNPKSKLSKKI